MTSTGICLDIADLRVRYPDNAMAVRGISIQIRVGETIAVVGESGCGKTTIANAIVGGLPRRSVVEGAIRLHTPTRPNGIDLLCVDESSRRALRGREVGYVPQNPYGSCDPMRSVAHHVNSAWRVHGLTPPDSEAAALVERLGVQNAHAKLRERPHTWSGGMLQRASIAGGAALSPALVVADEPTSALDAELAHSTLDALRATGAAILLITHDLMLAAEIADRVYILYAGEIMEEGAATSLLARPRHPYSKALLAAIPRGRRHLPVGLEGSPPGPHRSTEGCAFVDRCPARTDACATLVPDLIDGVRCLHPTESA